MKTSIWYHTRLSGHGINPEYALDLFSSQIDRIVASGLLPAAEELIVCVNGDEQDASAIYDVIDVHDIDRPYTVEMHGSEERSELRTLKTMHRWARSAPGRNVIYLHEKGVTYTGDERKQGERWRDCMSRHLIDDWETQVAALYSGVDSCGCHWLTPERYPGVVQTPFWGGNFWWASTEFIATLPELPAPSWECRHDAEAWIGSGPRPPVVHDCHPEWPGPGCEYS